MSGEQIFRGEDLFFEGANFLGREVVFLGSFFLGDFKGAKFF